MKMVAALLLGMALTAASPPAPEAQATGAEAPAPPRTLVVRNLADQPLFRLYVETVRPSCWCEDVLGDRIVAPHESVTINLADEKACRYDLVAEMKDGSRISQYNVDLCARHVWAVGPGSESRME